MRRRFTPLLLAAFTLLFFLFVTYGIWRWETMSLERNRQTAFSAVANESVNAIVQRLEGYKQVLRGTKGFLRGGLDIDRGEFRSYVDTLRLNESYPGVQGIGVSQLIAKPHLDRHIAAVRKQGFAEYAIRPVHERDVYTSIIAIEPFDAMNRRAFGYDMYSEPVRRAAMEQSRDTGRSALSGKVTLVQEAGSNPQPGFLMYLPVYRQNMPTGTVDQRRAALLGWVYAPFRMNDFMSGLGKLSPGDLHLAVYDGGSVSAQSCLFGCARSTHDSSLLTVTNTVTVAGRPWTIRITSTPAFEKRVDGVTPWLIAGGGIVTGGLLALLVWALASGRSRAIALALNMTQELRSSHRQIAAEQQRMKVILENSHDAFVAIGTDGRVTDWNIQAERTFGWSADEAIGKDLAQLIIPENQRAAHAAGYRQFTASGAGNVIGNRVEVMAAHRNGQLIPVELAVASIQTGAGHTANAFIRDLTERKAAERREAARQKTLDETRTALQHAQKLEAVGKLTGGVAHDFNNVLQIISGNVQLLLHVVGTREQQEKRLRSTLEAVDRGAKLSAQLLAFARRQPLEPRATDLRRLLANMSELLQQALGSAIHTEVSAAPDLWNTLVDPHQLENVIFNLAINARDAMNGRGTLVIGFENVVLGDGAPVPPDVQAGQYVMLTVSDNGAGMPPEVVEQAFEPFFTTKPDGEGTGLGLSMAYGFVRQSGGHIRIDSALGQGTTVTIHLPRSVEVLADPVVQAASAPVAGGTETVLVVEDDDAVRMTVVATLTDLGYRVIKARDAASGLEILKAGTQADLLFTDVVMPGPVRSTELAKEAKRLLPRIAILFTSGYTQNAIVHGGRLDPDVNLLSKPYRREQLAQKIRQVLDQQRQHAGWAGLQG